MLTSLLLIVVFGCGDDDALPILDAAAMPDIAVLDAGTDAAQSSDSGPDAASADTGPVISDAAVDTFDGGPDTGPADAGPCLSPRLICDGNCVDPNTDNTFCGAIADCSPGYEGQTCEAGTTCVDRVCTAE